MILTLDVGNSQIYGGVFKKDELLFTFRKTSFNRGSSDEIGLFLKIVLKENGIDPQKIDEIAVCSVVPDLVHSIGSACIKYLDKKPFLIQAGVKTGLHIKYRNPIEVGSDRIANAIAATHLYPKKNIIIVDLGTATTFCAINSHQDYLGGSIMAGLKISMEALESNTAKLPLVEIGTPKEIVGRSTTESIQSGLYYAHLGAIKELVQQITKEHFTDNKPVVFGTGGFASLFKNENVFNVIKPNLVLQGIYLALKLNR